MKRYLLTGLTILLALFYSAVWTSADGGNKLGRATSIYSDVKAKRIGDVITVIISESNSASKSAQTGTKKSDKGSATGTAATGALNGLFPGMGGTINYGNQYTGQASTTRSGSLNSRMTVMVVDVLPNNNLIVEGSKTLEVNEDTEVVTLSGVVQPEYISAQNTVLSTQLANAKFVYKGKGSVSQGHRIGFLGRVLNWIF